MFSAYNFMLELFVTLFRVSYPALTRIGSLKLRRR